MCPALSLNIIYFSVEEIEEELRKSINLKLLDQLKENLGMMELVNEFEPVLYQWTIYNIWGLKKWMKGGRITGDSSFWIWGLYWMFCSWGYWIWLLWM